jgi:hypothetical protein
LIGPQTSGGFEFDADVRIRRVFAELVLFNERMTELDAPPLDVLDRRRINLERKNCLVASFVCVWSVVCARSKSARKL